MAGSECLGADTLVDLVEGRADDDAFARAAAHASGCATCRELLSALARFDRPEAATLRDPPGAPERPSMLAVGARVGRYELVTMLGAGAMGYVYAARDPELARTVALKLLRPDVGGPDAQLTMQARLRREAQAMAQLAHPNVVAVHDVGVYEDRVFVAMEYIEGVTLAGWLAERKRSQREILAAFIAAGRGLAAAHAAGLVHRDFKPENVLVGDDGRVRVGDFGLARPFDRRIERFAKQATRDTPTDLTSTGTVVGTPLYMAPEQYLGEPADARSDQFSFCVALHHAIYGTRPFAGESFHELAASVLGGRIAPTPDVRVRKRVRDAIRRGLALEPKDRWPSMDALLRELRARPRRRLFWLAPAATGVAAIAAIVLVSTRSSAPPSCDHDYLNGAWGDARKTKIRAALATTKMPYVDATAAEVVRLGDRYANDWLRMRVGVCEAHERGQLKLDAYSLEAICLALRKRDLDAVADRLEIADARVAAHAVDAMTAVMPIDVCGDREMLRLLVGPPDPAARAAINRVIGELHALRAARELDDETAPVDRIVKQAAAIDAPAVRAEVLALAGSYAAGIADFQRARDWLGRAVADAVAGRHDAAEALALADEIVVVAHELRHGDAADALIAQARTAAARVHGRPEIELARLHAEAQFAADRGRLDDARTALDAAIALADARYAERDLRRGAPREAMIRILVEAGRAADARPFADALVALRRGVLGDDHPAVAAATIALADVQAITGDVAAAAAGYQRAIAVAERAADARTEADALAQFAALHVRQGDTAAARTMYERAVHLDATAYKRAHPAAIRHLAGLAALDKLVGARAKAIERYDQVLAAQRALYDAGDPRIAETEAALAGLRHAR